MPRRTTHIAQKLKAAVTLLLLLLCVCSAVARDTTRVFSKLPWDPNTAGGANGLGGAYTFDYQYDNLYRLTSSTGSFAPTNASYFLEMHYTPAGRICRKEQGDNNGSKRLLYSYNPHNAPHAARRIYDPSTTNLRQMLWDANGNIAQISEYLYDATNEIVNLQDFRNHYWDEDDRLNLVLDNSHFSYYLYGYDGQRVAKLTGSAFTLGTGFATNAMLDNYTLYPSEYLVVTKQGYTKYYYANGTRIASKLGSGGFEKMQRLCTEDLNLTANANTLFNSVVANIGNAMSDYHISDPCPNYYSDIAGFRVQLPTLNFNPNFGITAQQNILQTFRQNYANEETYYFHGNHLGSANWVTLQNASPTQFLLHLPYGEEFVKQLSGSYDERFTFTGKEKDIETGYYYFGARFDNVDLGFMSVDPMSDKYPSMSPYAYCAWNPIKLVDPEGKSTQVLDNGDGTYKVVGGNVKDGDNGIYLQELDGSNGKLIAYSATPESFYNSDNGKFMGTINPKDNSGRKFLNEKIVNSPLLEYMAKALPTNPYDFKRTNGTDKVIYTEVEDFYRGMQIGEESGLPIWASARDVGNIAAGYIAGRYGFSWNSARMVFDLLESLQNKKLSKETSCTVYAERLGYNIGSAINQMMMIKELSRLPSYGSDIFRNTVPIPNTIIKKL